MAKDPHWSNVVLAMHMDGADNGAVFPDLTGKTVSCFNNTQTKIATKKFGVSSAYFDSLGDYLSVPYSSAFVLQSSDFTIEAWVYVTALQSAANFICLRRENANVFAFHVLPSGYLEYQYWDASNVSYSLVATTSITLNQWAHVAVTRVGSVYRLFLDGVKVSESVLATTPREDSLSALWIGGHGSTPDRTINGYIDDLRITKGVARYTANFTPPTEAFPNGPYEVGGTILDANNSPVSRTIRVYDRVTGALAGSGQSSPVTGIYNVAINTSNEVQVVMLDDVLGTTENDQILRTTPV